MVFKVYGSNFHLDPKYRLIGPLGRGSYGVVCAALDTSTNRKVAIKKITPMASHITDAKHNLREIRMMRYLGVHSNVISLIDIAIQNEKDELYLVMELMDTDLHRVIQSKQPLTEKHHRFFMYQVHAHAVTCTGRDVHTHKMHAERRGGVALPTAAVLSPPPPPART
jgi:serine/threonine protein kinase